MAVTNALNQTVNYQYTQRGELEKVWGATEPVDYSYDAYVRQHTMTTYRDGGGDVTTWNYDEATGLLREKVYADSNKTTYAYTPEGRMLTRQWARGVTTTYSYDPATGDLTLRDYSDATPDVTFADYDAQGRPHTITDAQGTRTLSYAAGGILSGDSLTGIAYTHDNGRVNGLSLGSYAVTYGYDATTGRFNSLTYQPGTADEQTFTYGYVPNSNLPDIVSSTSGLAVTKTYEPHRDVVTRVQNQFGSNVVSQYDYVYDAVRRRTSMITSGAAIDTLPPPTVQEEELTYTTNALNQYSQITTSTGTIGLAYDDDGNLTNDGTFEYTYNAENRLIEAVPSLPTDGLHKVEMAYDYLGRRVSKTVYSYSSGTWILDKTITFVYDGWNVITESTTTGGSTSTAQYVWGLDLSGTLQGAGGIGGLLLRKSGTGTFAYLYDANGNAEQLVNVADGSLAARYKYDPFGVLLVADGPEAAGNPYRYSTKYFMPDIGWYDYGMRPYAPELGRWTTRDPIEEQGGLNLYGFVGNDPVNFIDILGLVLVTWKGDGYAYICGSNDSGVTDFVSLEHPTKAAIAEQFGLSVEALDAFIQNSSLSTFDEQDELPSGTKLWVVLTPCGDTNLLARLAYSEGTSDNERDKYAVASVIINRIAHKEKYPQVSPYESTIQTVISQKTPGGAYEFEALTKPKWTNSANPAGLQRINDIVEWNLSVKGAEQAMNVGALSDLQGATIFHSTPQYGEQEKIVPGQVATKYWTVEYITQIGGHYYFVITPKIKR